MVPLNTSSPRLSGCPQLSKVQPAHHKVQRIPFTAFKRTSFTHATPSTGLRSEYKDRIPFGTYLLLLLLTTTTQPDTYLLLAIPWLPMSQFNDHCFLSYQVYDPRLFGHPHQLPLPQATEPFWQQHQEARNICQVPYPNYQPAYYPSYRAMDSQTVYIGRNTTDGRKAPTTSKSRPNPERRRHALGYVQVSARDQYLDNIPLARLVRFSNAARRVFPKPESETSQKDAPVKTELKHGSKGDTANGNLLDEVKDAVPKPFTNWAAEAAEKEIDVEEVTADMKKLKAPTESDTAATTADADAEETYKWLDVDDENISVLPDVTAFKFAFQWMRDAHESFLDYGVPHPDLCSLQQLVDIHAVAICLDMRPLPRKHIADLNHRLTERPPSLKDIQYLHTHLPLNDVVITRAITSYVRSSEKRHGRRYYSNDERKAIDEYMRNADPGLAARFDDIIAHRNEKSTAWRTQRNQDDLQKQAQSIGCAPAEEAEDTYPILAQSAAQGSRRRNRREQQRMGKSPEGKLVPGANY